MKEPEYEKPLIKCFRKFVIFTFTIVAIVYIAFKEYVIWPN